MPSRNYGRGKNYRARAKITGDDGTQKYLHLGFFDTWQEAKQVEEAFWLRRGGRRRYPQLRKLDGRYA